MTASDKLSPSQKQKSKVPNVNCLGCGSEIYLDDVTYANYRGQVACLQCRQRQYVDIQMGRLAAAQLSQGYYEAIKDILAWEIPQEILGDVAEAAHVYLNGAFKSCVVMCRRCLQATLLEKGLIDQRLALMIDEALRQKILSQRLYDQAMAVKKFGDSGAHPKDNELREVTELDAGLCISILKEVLKSVFTLRQAQS